MCLHDGCCVSGDLSEAVSAGLVEKGVYEGGAVEGDDVFEFFTGAGVDDREFQLRGNGENDTAFGGAVEFREDDAGDAGGFREEPGLG
jgi:hypothetical protein